MQKLIEEEQKKFKEERICFKGFIELVPEEEQKDQKGRVSKMIAVKVSK